MYLTVKKDPIVDQNLMTDQFLSNFRVEMLTGSLFNVKNDTGSVLSVEK